MLSSVRSGKKKQHTISDLMQSIKGNFSRTIQQGNIWQKRFNTRIVNANEYIGNRYLLYQAKSNQGKFIIKILQTAVSIF